MDKNFFYDTLDILEYLDTLDTLDTLANSIKISTVSTVSTVSTCTRKKDGLSAYPNAGYLSFLFDPAMLPGGQDHRKNAVKLARFMHGLGVKNGHKTPDNSLIMVIRAFDKNTYHNHEFTNPNFSHNIQYFQMINDLQGRFEDADNFSLV